MAALIRERLYPELELFRTRHGHLEEFPPLEKDDMKAFEPTEQEAEACTRCKHFEESFQEASRKLESQVGAA